MLPIRPAIRTSRRHSRDLHLRFSPLLYERVDLFGAENGLGLNSSVRLLVERGLTIDTDGLMTGQELASQLRVLANSVLAGVIASEQTHLLVASLIPGGRQRVNSFLEEAATGAHVRLLRLETAVIEEAGC
jgi:hypothetical protein